MVCYKLITLGFLIIFLKGDEDSWNFLVVATRDVTIPKGTRICQFRIIENQPQINFKVVDKLDNKNRGGIGSTGTM